MRDTELYQNLLGILSPWSVESVLMDVEKQRVDVTVTHLPKTLFLVRNFGLVKFSHLIHCCSDPLRPPVLELIAQ